MPGWLIGLAQILGAILIIGLLIQLVFGPDRWGAFKALVFIFVVVLVYVAFKESFYNYG